MQQFLIEKSTVDKILYFDKKKLSLPKSNKQKIDTEKRELVYTKKYTRCSYTYY